MICEASCSCNSLQNMILTSAPQDIFVGFQFSITRRKPVQTEYKRLIRGVSRLYVIFRRSAGVIKNGWSLVWLKRPGCSERETYRRQRQRCAKDSEMWLKCKMSRKIPGSDGVPQVHDAQFYALDERDNSSLSKWIKHGCRVN